MMRLITLSLLVLLTACVAGQQTNSERVAAAPAPPGGPVCRVGPEGEPLAADQHIAEGGMGGAGAPSMRAERGIGGTGAPSMVAERGIGGTGIVGVITGFASVCVDGLEVQYDKSSVVEIDGVAASASALRAGQVVAIRIGAAGPGFAQAIAVRREVAGRIEAVELGSGMLTIAGQSVSVPAATWGADTARLGDWVSVSGLRRADGVLVASRLDGAPTGVFSARGTVVREAGVVRVGQLVLDGAESAGLTQGQSVQISGRYADGQAKPGAVVPDTLFADPASYFGSAVNRLVVQGFVHVANGAVLVDGLKAAAGPGVQGRAGADAIAVVSLERKVDGSFAAVDLRYSEHIGPEASAVRTRGRSAHGEATAGAPVRRSAGSVVASGSDAGSTAPLGAPNPPMAQGGDPVDASLGPRIVRGPSAGTIAVTLPLPSLVETQGRGPPEVAPVAVPTVVEDGSPRRFGNDGSAEGGSHQNGQHQDEGTGQLISGNGTHHSNGGSSVTAAMRGGTSGGTHLSGANRPVIAGGSTSHGGIGLVTGGVSGTGSGHTGTGSSHGGSGSVASPVHGKVSGGKDVGGKAIGTSSASNSASSGKQHGR